MDEDAIREGYGDLQSYRDAWKKLNGNWEPNRVVYVVRFELKESYIISSETTAIATMHTFEGEKVLINSAH